MNRVSLDLDLGRRRRAAHRDAIVAARARSTRTVDRFVARTPHARTHARTPRFHSSIHPSTSRRES